MITKHVFALWIVSVAPVATGETLYLLSGSPTPTSTEHFVSALYAWRQGALSKVRDVMPISEFILEEPVNRTIVLADLNVKHKRIELIVEDTPDQPFGLDIPLMKDGWFVSRIAILRPSSGEATLALWLLRLGANDLMESDLWGISLNSPDRSLKRLTPELLKHAVATGKSGVVDLGTTDSFSARVQDDSGLLNLYFNGGFVPTSVLAPPPYLEPRRFSFVLDGLNQDLAALRVSQPVEKSGVWVLNRAAGKWTQISTPYPTTEVRTLGSWVAVAETEPTGKAGSRTPSKARKVPTGMGPAIAHRMGYRHIRLPGRITLFHSTDGQQLRIETGEDDTEVLAIHEGKVYYRVNDQLWQTGILKDKLAPPELVFESPVIGDVHWIFWGPDEPGK